MGLQSFDDGNSDEARQWLLDQKGARSHPKRHRTLNRSRRLSAAKKVATKHNVAVRLAQVRKYKAKVADYWAGLGDHP